MTPEELEAKIKLYEQNGAAKLYYALNRKMNEMANLLNDKDLATLAIDDPKNKTFDRLKVIWSDASSIASGIEALGRLAKVTGDEEADVSKRPFNDRLAENRN